MAVAPVRITYKKPCLTSEQHIELLRGRGLAIDNEPRALRYLDFIGYYRLMAYSRVYQPNVRNGDHTFAVGTTFDQILKLYIFDRKLRVLVIDALERIEVAFRATISNEMSKAYGAHWYTKKKHFQQSFNRRRFMKEVREKIGVKKPANTQRPFISHYFSKYNKPILPPSWMTFEVLSFGSVSYLFQNLNKQDQALIAKHFDLQATVLISWMRSLSSLRNVCAHHEILWNRTFLVNQPKIAKGFESLISDNKKLYGHLVILRYLLGKISDTKKWSKQIKHLVDNEGPHLRHANVETVMGFPTNWYELELWGLPRVQRAAA